MTVTIIHGKRRILNDIVKEAQYRLRYSEKDAHHGVQTEEAININNAKVYGNAMAYGNAKVYGNANVFGNVAEV